MRLGCLGLSLFCERFSIEGRIQRFWKERIARLGFPARLFSGMEVNTYKLLGGGEEEEAAGTYHAILFFQAIFVYIHSTHIFSQKENFQPLPSKPLPSFITSSFPLAAPPPFFFPPFHKETEFKSKPNPTIPPFQFPPFFHNIYS